MAARVYPELYNKLKKELADPKKIATELQKITGCVVFFPSNKGRKRSFAEERFYEISDYLDSGLSWREISHKYREVGITISHGSLSKGYKNALHKFSVAATRQLERTEELARIREAEAAVAATLPRKISLEKTSQKEQSAVSAIGFGQLGEQPEVSERELLRYIESEPVSNPFSVGNPTTKKKEDIPL